MSKFFTAMFNFLFSEYLEEGEKIHYVAHRHPFVLLQNIWRPILFTILLPLVFIFFLPAYLIFGAIWLLIGCLRVLYQFADWFFDVWLLTNSSVIDLDWNGFFSRGSNRLEYHMIEGVSYQYIGVLQTLLRYGDIYVQRVGSGVALALKDGLKPRRVESEVLKLQTRFITDKSYRDHDALKNLLSEMIHHHINKK